MASIPLRQRRRHVTVPTELCELSPDWADAYNRQLAKTPSAHPPFARHQNAIATIRDALTPTLHDSV